MTLSYNPDPHTRLLGVHPDLIRVFMRACETFKGRVMVVEGARSIEQMKINYGKGRTGAQCLAKGIEAKYAQPTLDKVTWLNNPLKSNHGKKADDYGHALDAVVLEDDGSIDWGKHGTAHYDAMDDAMEAAAKELGVALRYGGNWDGDEHRHEPGETDLDHWEIP